MSPLAQSLLHDWSPPILVNISLIIAAFFYLRGWIFLRRSSHDLISPSRLAAFFAGISFLWIAIGSPLSAFDESSLTVHMIQHILLMLVVPPLVLLGAPFLPFLHGLPQGFVRTTLGPFLRWRPVQSLGKFLTHPAVCWIFASGALLAWHVPSVFELAIRSDAWHELEHFCFLSTSILFWWPVVQPFPCESRWPRWTILLYLFFGSFPGGALGAFLVFCDRVLYPSYIEAPSIFGITPLEDQIFAGSLMWVFGLFVLLFPAVFITFHLLSRLDPGYQSHHCVKPRGIEAQPCEPMTAPTSALRTFMPGC